MAERTTLDRTVMLEEMIEHDPELRDVLNRRRFFKELISSAAEDSDRIRELRELYRMGTTESLSELLRRMFQWETVVDPRTNVAIADSEGQLWSMYVDQQGRPIMARLIALGITLELHSNKRAESNAKAIQ